MNLEQVGARSLPIGMSVPVTISLLKKNIRKTRRAKGGYWF